MVRARVVGDLPVALGIDEMVCQVMNVNLYTPLSRDNFWSFCGVFQLIIWPICVLQRHI